MVGVGPDVEIGAHDVLQEARESGRVGRNLGAERPQDAEQRIERDVGLGGDRLHLCAAGLRHLGDGQKQLPTLAGDQRLVPLRLFRRHAEIEEAPKAFVDPGSLPCPGVEIDLLGHHAHHRAELFALDNVVLSPHQGSATHQTRDAMGALLVANLERHFAGEPLISAVV